MGNVEYEKNAKPSVLLATEIKGAVKEGIIDGTHPHKLVIWVKW